MADKNWRERLTEADLKNWQWAYDRWVERDAEEWAMSPRNPSFCAQSWMRRWREQSNNKP